MFPCRSINYQNNPRTNQTLINFDDQSQYHFPPNFQTYDDDHRADHCHKPVLPYSNNNEALMINPQTLGEDEAAMLSHLMSQNQLLACNSQPSPGKKIRSNKDRHSKICTAQGLRDRRMRLSLQIARKFFDLQDLLGFDKASRTIDWLFTKSKTAIDELKGSPLSSSSNSTSAGETGHTEIDVPRIGHGNNKNNIAKRKVVVLRESRDKARARARARTREKKMLEKSGQSSVGVVTNDQKCFHGGCDRVEPNSPFQVGFPQSSIYEAPTSSEHTLNPNFPRSTYDDSEKQNPNPNFTASDFLPNSNIFTLNF